MTRARLSVFCWLKRFSNYCLGTMNLFFASSPLWPELLLLFCFIYCCGTQLSGLGLLIGLALFAFSPELIYYSSEMKQYIVDVAVTISLLLLAMPILEGQARKTRLYLPWAGWGLGLWFSHPALFVLAGLGVGLFIQALEPRNRSKISTVLMLGVIWLANLGLLYFVSFTRA